MKTLHVVGISVLSTLLTVITVLALLFNGGAAIAQNPDPATPNEAAVKIVDEAVPAGSAPAVADTADEVSAPQAGTHYLHVSGNAFEPLYNTDKREYSGYGCIYMTGTPPTYVNYPLNLPYGSTASQVTMYYRDDSTSNARLRLVRYDDGLSTTNIFTLTTTTDDTSVHALTVNLDPHLSLNYLSYSYVLQWDQLVSGTELQLCSVRIAYTEPPIFGIAMPLVQKNAP